MSGDWTEAVAVLLIILGAYLAGRDHEREDRGSRRLSAGKGEK